MIKFQSLPRQKRHSIREEVLRLYAETDMGYGEIAHLHAAVCRKDMDGITNIDHHIEKWAQNAAETVALRRGWTTPQRYTIQE